MAFQLKNYVSIAASILNFAKAAQTKLTDFAVGSVARTMLEAPAVEIEELYQQMWNGLKESIPVAIYNSFDFTRLDAVAATGLVTVTITSSGSDLRIPAGTSFAPNDGSAVTYKSLSDFIIPAGNTVASILVKANTAGMIGNIPADTEFTLTPTPAGIVSAVASFDFTTGSDEETDAQRKTRFKNYITTLNHGTVTALSYGVSTVRTYDSNGQEVERVRYRRIIEPWLADDTKPISLVEVYIHNGVNGASSNLLGEVEKVLYGYTDDSGKIIVGWKAAGTKVKVYAATSTIVDISASIWVDSEYDSASVVEEVKSAISTYISGLDIGQSILMAEIISAAMAIDGMINIVPTNPTEDIAFANTEKPMPGTITMTVA